MCAIRVAIVEELRWSLSFPVYFVGRLFVFSAAATRDRPASERSEDRRAPGNTFGRSCRPVRDKGPCHPGSSSQCIICIVPHRSPDAMWVSSVSSTSYQTFRGSSRDLLQIRQRASTIASKLVVDVFFAPGPRQARTGRDPGGELYEDC